MTKIPPHIRKYSETPEFTETSAPAKLTSLHNTKKGVWGRLLVIEGELDYVIEGPPKTYERIQAGAFGVIEPMVIHHVDFRGPVKFKIEFLK